MTIAIYIEKEMKAANVWHFKKEEEAGFLSEIERRPQDFQKII